MDPSPPTASESTALSRSAAFKSRLVSPQSMTEPWVRVIRSLPSCARLAVSKLPLYHSWTRLTWKEEVSNVATALLTAPLVASLPRSLMVPLENVNRTAATAVLSLLGQH
jgi:hypothetical protein